MTNTYNTGNPLGSTDPRDLLDNASNLDDGMNSVLPTFTDRLGVSRDTWQGQQDQFQLAQTGRETEFQQFLADSGFVSLGNYAAGLEFTAYNQYMAYGGFFYRPAPSSIPFITSGTWVGADEDLFALFSQDDVLRGDLANIASVSLGAALVGRSAQYVESITALRALLKTTPSKFARTKGYYAGSQVGGGLYWMDAADTTSADNGGSIIVATDGGRWRLVLDGPVTIEQFGASPSVADNGPNIQAALSWAAGAPVYAGPGIFPIVTPIVYDTTGDGEVEGAKLIGAGKKVTIFDNQHTGIMLSISSGPSFTDFQNNIQLEHFGVINSLNRPANSGIQLTGLRFGRVAPSVTDQGSHGLWLTSTVNDASDCINLDIVDGDYERNGGWGIFIDADLNGVHANLDVSNNRCIENTLGGIWAATCTTCRFTRNAIAYNGGDGLNLAKRAGGSFGRNNIVELNEFDSQGDQCVIQGQINTVCNNNYVIANSGVATPMVRGFVVTDSIGTRIDKTLPRVAPGLTGITLFDVNAGSSYTSLIDTDYSSWESAGNTKYTNSSATTEIIELESLTVSGAWTPIDSSGAGLVFTGASGRYVRNGNSITVTGQLTFPATANASNITIGGLPFQALTLSPGGLLTSGGAAGDQCAVLAATTTIAVYGTTLTRRTNANYTGQTIIFSATYILA